MSRAAYTPAERSHRGSLQGPLRMRTGNSSQAKRGAITPTGSPSAQITEDFPLPPRPSKRS